MRLLITGQTYAPAVNGQAVFTTHLAEGLARLGHTVRVVVPSSSGVPFLELHQGVEVQGIRSFNLSHWHNEAYFATLSPWKAHQLVSEFRPDVVHVQDHYPMSRTLVFAARQSGVRAVGTNHFMPENLAPYLKGIARIRPVFNWVLWHWVFDLYNRLNMVTAPSKTAAAILRAEGLKAPVVPVSCGVSLDTFKPDAMIDRTALRLKYNLDPAKTILLFVGRVDGEKRIDVMLRALKLFDYPDLQFAVAGAGAASAELRALAAELDLSDKVRFLGFVPPEDLPGLLNSVDVFAMPSEAELLSIASLEAMATGLPVLAARARALPELVTEGVNGWLFEPGSPSAAAAALQRVVDAKAYWPQMAQASLDKASLHSLMTTLYHYEMVYEGVLARRDESEMRAQLEGALAKRRPVRVYNRRR